MTSHRLVKCQIDELVAVAAVRHPHVFITHPADRPAMAATRCRHSRPSQLVWRERATLGRWITYSLVIEQGANGVIAHLSAHVPARDPGAVSWTQVVAGWWASRELGALMRAAEGKAVRRRAFQRDRDTHVDDDGSMHDL